MGRKTVYNDVFNEELWEKVNKDNKDLLNDFVEYKKSSNKSSQTIYKYYQAMRIFFIWNLEHNNNKFF